MPTGSVCWLRCLFCSFLPVTASSLLRHLESLQRGTGRWSGWPRVAGAPISECPVLPVAYFTTHRGKSQMQTLLFRSSSAAQNSGAPEICLLRRPLCVDLPVATLPYLWSSFDFSASRRADFLLPLTGCAGAGGLLGFWSRLVNGAGVWAGRSRL